MGTALKTNIESMKLFVVLSLASVAIGGMDYEMVQKWQKLKAMESCWGEENMKLVMVEMKKNRNSYTPYSSNSHHGNSNMEKMKMMMKMMKMSNMMNDNQDYSSSSYSNDNDAFDMFSEIFDSSDRMDNYRSSYDNKNQMGRMSHFKNMF